MEIEYLVKLRDGKNDKPIIYLLQARPLSSTVSRSFETPTHIKCEMLKEENGMESIPTSTLLDGNSYVRVLEKQQDLLIDQDLPKALNAYLKSRDPSKIKLIVIRKTAPSTSHEAVILRPKEVAVMVVSDPLKFNALKKMIQCISVSTPLLADPQRGLILQVSKGNDPSSMIAKGLVSYPIPLEVSIPLSNVMNIPADKGHLMEGVFAFVQQRMHSTHR